MCLKDVMDSIQDLDMDLMLKVQDRLDNLSKPLRSLGRLEDIVKHIAGITGSEFPKVDKKAVIIMCSDNGVVEEGISQSTKEITSIVTQNFTRGITCINVFTRHTGAETVVVDIGVDDDIDCPGIINRKIRKGTWNIAKGPAMTRDEVVRAIKVGVDTVKELKDRGVNLLGTGEMGIGNTTTSSAITAMLTSSRVEDVVGRGAGLSSSGLRRKIDVIKQAIEVNKPDREDVIDVLAKLGGFDIAGLTGCFIGAAVYRIPILIDGFISSTAALAAIRLKPVIKDYVFPSHGSAEPGSSKVLDFLGYKPMMNLGMCLGEGTGAALAFHIVDAAIAAYTQMGTFNDAEIEQYKPLD